MVGKRSGREQPITPEPNTNKPPKTRETRLRRPRTERNELTTSRQRSQAIARSCAADAELSPAMKVPAPDYAVRQRVAEKIAPESFFRRTAVPRFPRVLQNA